MKYLSTYIYIYINIYIHIYIYKTVSNSVIKKTIVWQIFIQTLCIWRVSLYFTNEKVMIHLWSIYTSTNKLFKKPSIWNVYINLTKKLPIEKKCVCNDIKLINIYLWIN